MRKMTYFCAPLREIPIFLPVREFVKTQKKSARSRDLVGPGWGLYLNGLLTKYGEIKFLFKNQK